MTTDERRPQGRRAADEVGGQHDTITVPNPANRITRRRELLLLELRAAHRRDDPIAVEVCTTKLSRIAGPWRPRTISTNDEIVETPQAPDDAQVSAVSTVVPTGDAVSTVVPTGRAARRRAGRRRHGNRAGR